MSINFKALACAATMAIAATSAGAALKADQLIYHAADTLPLLGTAAPDASKAYSRLPDSLQEQIRPELWALGQNSAGLAIRFASDASTIGARWTSLNKFNMNHMTATGIRGVDLYVMQDDSTWTTLGSGRPAFHERTTSTVIGTDMTPKMREYMLFLSLYDGIDSLYIGVDSAAVVLQPRIDLPVRERPVVVYGTSVVQGGCATRPGMVHTAMLQRELQREVMNFGFSGNARLDPEIARVMASVPAGVYVLDALPNCSSDLLRERLADFYHILRDAHPDVPILFVESALFPIMRFNNETNETITEKNRVNREIFDGLVAAGEKNIYYFEGERVLGTTPADQECTVDNYHLTDAGFAHFAAELLPVLRQLLGE